MLKDDKTGFISYLSSVMMMEDFAEQNPDLVGFFEKIGEPLTEELMIDLNRRVDVHGELPEDVAEQYLREQGFIS